MSDLETTLSAPGSLAEGGGRVRLQRLARSVGMKHGLIMAASMVLAGIFDYAVNVVAGRWLQPADFGIFISVTALLQILLLLSITIRTVVAFYTAELSAQGQSSSGVGALLQRAWRWAWQWGLVGTALMALMGPFVARLLRLPNSWPVWAASVMVLMLFLRETTYGALQGIQEFWGLGLVQIIQAFLRLVLAAGLILLGYRAVGAIIAQPLGCVFAVGMAVWWLRLHFRNPSHTFNQSISWRYSGSTLLGLTFFGALINLDALFVKHFFSPQIAGNYAPVVTLAKVSLFLPWAVGMVLLPKVTRRLANGRDPRPIFLVSLLAALAPGLGITTIFFLEPGAIVRMIFTGAYSNPGIVLGLANLASTLYAGLFVWLNCAFSSKRPAFIYSLGGLLVGQGLGMYLFGRESLVSMTLIMVSAGLVGNVIGLATVWSVVPTPKAIRAKVAQ